MQPAEYGRVAEAEDRHWWYRATRRMAGDLLAPHLASGQRILDAGCGPGGNGAWLSAHGRVVGIDIAPEALRFVRARRPELVPVRGGIERLPFASDSFDVVLEITVLTMVEDDGAAVAELARVTRPGGAVLLVEPAFAVLRREHDLVVRSRRRYRRADLVAAAERAGLRVTRATYAHAALTAPALALALWERARGAGRRQARQEQPRSDLQRGDVGPLFGAVAALERRLLRRRDLPVGVSVAVLATKAAPG